MPVREDLCVSIEEGEGSYIHVGKSDHQVAGSVVGMLVMGSLVAQLLWRT